MINEWNRRGSNYSEHFYSSISYFVFLLIFHVEYASLSQFFIVNQRSFFIFRGDETAMIVTTDKSESQPRPVTTFFFAHQFSKNLSAQFKETCTKKVFSILFYA